MNQKEVAEKMLANSTEDRVEHCVGWSFKAGVLSDAVERVCAILLFTDVGPMGIGAVVKTNTGHLGQKWEPRDGMRDGVIVLDSCTVPDDVGDAAFAELDKCRVSDSSYADTLSLKEEAGVGGSRCYFHISAEKGSRVLLPVFALNYHNDANLHELLKVYDNSVFDGYLTKTSWCSPSD